MSSTFTRPRSTGLRPNAPWSCTNPLQQLRRAKLRDPRGDRVIAQMLAIMPTAGLDAVLSALELALEDARRGRVNVKNVLNLLNVLARLNAEPVPESAATALQVATKPLANTDRYDSLLTGAVAIGDDRPCVSWPSNSSNCACTTWPARGLIWWTKAAVAGQRWTTRAGCLSTCYKPAPPTGQCAR